MSLAFVAEQSVHRAMGTHIIYVRRSYKEANAADVSDEAQEADCRALLPVGARVRVISDSGGHRSGASTEHRDGYRALLGAVAAGEVAGLAVHDLSRLARNARLMFELRDELERHQVPLLVANLPGASFDGATGRYMFGQFCLANQLQRDLDSERMTGMLRRQFEAGRHRGHDPFGYRSLRDDAGDLVHPRQLVIVPEEAAIVRRVFRELTRHSYAEVAELMTREGLLRGGRPWTRDSVKDIVRRARVYLGYVVEKRGREERPGLHEPILSDAQYRATQAAIAARTRAGNKPRPFRHYLLRGLVWCGCGTKMRGEAHVQRGTDRRYYRCPKVGCGARRSPAEGLEETVLAAIGGAVLPDEVIDRARAELQARLGEPVVPVPARQRARLSKRLEQLKKQHGWGDLEDAEYQAQRDEVRAALRELPDDDRVRSFDAFRTQLLTLPEAIAAASPSRRAELCRIVVQRVIVDDRQLGSLIWTPPSAPFFDRQRWRPQGDSNP